MASWEELDKEFQALASALQFQRLDYQWGAAGTYYRLSGAASQATRRFEVLASKAGQKLTGSLAEKIEQSLLDVADPAARWYEALRHRSGAFEHGLVAYQKDESGNPQGTLFTGHVARPAEASATLALMCSSMDEPMKDDHSVSSVGQSGGITGYNVSVHNASPAIATPERKRWWKSAYAEISGIVLLVAAVVAILAYFNIKPREAAMSDGKKTTVLSINQSGGITAHTVNVGAPPRQMNAEFARNIQQAIPKGSKVSVTVVMGDTEAFGFATQVVAWMKQNGYPNVDGVNQGVFSQPVAGQQLSKTADGYAMVIGGRQ